MDSTFRQDEKFSLGGISNLVVGLNWECRQGRHVDLDASCALFDGKGKFKELVYFGNLADSSGSVRHSGEIKVDDESEEKITVLLNQVPPDVRAIVIAVNSYSGESFGDVEKAEIRLFDTTPSKELEITKDEVQLGRFGLAVTGGMGRSKAMIMAKLHRSFTGWEFHVIGRGVEGRSVGDLIPQMQETLRDIISSLQVEPSPAIIVLTKGESISLDVNDQRLDQIALGLGWDVDSDSSSSSSSSSSDSFSSSSSSSPTISSRSSRRKSRRRGSGEYSTMSDVKGDTIDLDTSCVMFDDKGQTFDVVYFNNLSNTNGSVKHGGDNLTGEGEGDDEQIVVNLSKIPYPCSSLYFVVTSYNGQPLSRVRNAYVRLFNLNPTHASRRSGASHELIRFQLSRVTDERHTSMILCKIHLPPGVGKFQRPTATWRMKAIGYSGSGTTYTETIGDMQKDMAGGLPLTGGSYRYIPRPFQDRKSDGTRASIESIIPSHSNHTQQPRGPQSNSPLSRFALILVLSLLVMVFLNLLPANKSRSSGERSSSHSPSSSAYEDSRGGERRERARSDAPRETLRSDTDESDSSSEHKSYRPR